MNEQRSGFPIPSEMRMALIEKQKDRAKRTDDEIAISNEEFRPFAANGYFIVCPFLVALCEDDLTKSANLDSEISLRNPGGISKYEVKLTCQGEK